MTQPDPSPTSAQMSMGVAVRDPLQAEDDEARRGRQRDEDLEGARGATWSPMLEGMLVIGRASGCAGRPAWPPPPPPLTSPRPRGTIQRATLRPSFAQLLPQPGKPAEEEGGRKGEHRERGVYARHEGRWHCDEGSHA
jgi:hypothetical protein